MKIQLESIQGELQGLGIVGAWLFGSAQDGAVRDGGDVDIGILFDQKPDLDTLTSCRARIQAALQFEEVDLAPLNDASPVLRFEALCGKRIFCADEDRCAAFSSLAAREYEDEMALCGKSFIAGAAVKEIAELHVRHAKVAEGFTPYGQDAAK